MTQVQTSEPLVTNPVIRHEWGKDRESLLQVEHKLCLPPSGVDILLLSCPSVGCKSKSYILKGNPLKLCMLSKYDLENHIDMYLQHFH